MSNQDSAAREPTEERLEEIRWVYDPDEWDELPEVATVFADVRWLIVEVERLRAVGRWSEAGLRHAESALDAASREAGFLRDALRRIKTAEYLELAVRWADNALRGASPGEEARPQEDEVGWLIELVDMQTNGAIGYWVPWGSQDDEYRMTGAWVDDPSQAHRFPTKEGAESARATVSRPNTRVAEHLWSDVSHELRGASSSGSGVPQEDDVESLYRAAQVDLGSFRSELREYLARGNP